MNALQPTAGNLVIFDIYGPFAHFRKFYTNSSSLSYLVPPRTVLSGMMAGILGLSSELFQGGGEKDYYPEFSPDKAFIAVSLMAPVRKLMQTVNYLRTKTDSKKISFTDPTQIPLEILVPVQDEVRYRIYFAHENSAITSELARRLRDRRFVYPLYLGLSEFIGEASVPMGVKKAEPVILQEQQEKEVRSVCRVDAVGSLTTDEEYKFLSELMPTGFESGRNPLPPKEYIVEMNAKKIKAVFQAGTELFRVEYSDLKGNDRSELIMAL